MSLEEAIRGWLPVLFALCLVNTVAAQGQEQPGGVVYRFQVQGVGDPAAAKPVQYALLEHPSVTMCTYVEACACFKVASTVALDHATLSNWLLAVGRTLVGPVHGSDGSVLAPSNEPLYAR